jgi:hypothetical protein
MPFVRVFLAFRGITSRQTEIDDADVVPHHFEKTGVGVLLIPPKPRTND